MATWCLPVATINTLLLGPGTTVTHEAIKTATAANCAVCWVGEDSLLFYAAGFCLLQIPTILKRRWRWPCDASSTLKVARAMLLNAFRMPI